jgi:NAD(P)-dependent dehydrogenase (short-subunit alcohol dehydrogenase family)
MGQLEGTVALVTGAGSGIGNAIAARFGREGASVVVADVRREPKLDLETSVFEKLEDAGADFRYVETDVSSEADVEHAVETAVSEFGGLDILVNNAGIFTKAKLDETTPERWDEILDVNLRGLYLASRAAVPVIRESDRAKIVNLSSLFGVVAGAESAAYCASKGGVSNLTRQMALDYAEDEINVNALAPGLIKTAQNAEWRKDPAFVERRLSEIPWPRLGEPEDIANAALFLASAESDFVTGQVIAVDGGETAE